LKIIPSFKGYGFTMHLNRDKSAHFVGKVEPNSPADYGDLKEGARIVEVNGVNVEHEPHHDVGERIRRCTQEARLLVEMAVEEVDGAYSNIVSYQTTTTKVDMNRPQHAEFEPSYFGSQRTQIFLVLAN